MLFKVFYYFFMSGWILYVARLTKGIKRLSLNERTTFLIPNEIQEVLIGILLGDGDIVRRSLTSNSRLVYGQSETKHKEYFYHVYSIFSTFCTNNYKPQYKIFKDKGTEKEYNALIYTTMQLPCFNIFRENFYLLNVKIVPDNI